MCPFRPPRAPGFSYVGLHRYFLTICVRDRRPLFADHTAGRLVIAQGLPIAAQQHFAVIAYCVMPDHIHLLVEGESEDADLRAFVHRWKLVTGYEWKRQTGERLWQEGYYDRVLREDDDAKAVVRYVLDNPVRAGLVRSPADYPLLGSDRYSFADLADVVANWRPQR